MAVVDTVMESSPAMPAGGSRSAMTRRIEGYRVRLRAVIQAKLDPRLKARVAPSDIVAAAIIEARGGMAKAVRKGSGSFSAWIVRKALDKLAEVKKHHRAKKRDYRRDVGQPGGADGGSAVAPVDLVPDQGRSPSSCAGRKELYERIAGAFELLTEDHRQVMDLHYHEGLRFVAIAKRLGLAESTVRTRHYRALTELREILGVGPDGEL